MRVGSTSFVYPGDWRYNVERLRGRVEDIELLFFEAEGLPSDQEIASLGSLAEGCHSYTIHTPLSASLASESRERRRQGIEEVLRVISKTAPLQPFAWILHVYQGDFEGDAPPADQDAWRSRARESLREISERTGESIRLCVENLDYDYAAIAPVVEELGLGVAWDVGHDLRDNRSSPLMFERLWNRLRVVQWHGTDPDDRDHRSVAFVPRGDALELLGILSSRGFDGVLTLEVFREADFDESLTITHALLAELDAQ